MSSPPLTSERLQGVKTALFMPASNARTIEKAKSLAVDAVILDLEDAVAPEDKALARDTLLSALHTVADKENFGDRLIFARLNGVDTPYFEADCEAVAAAHLDGIVIPKVDGVETLKALPLGLAPYDVLAMIETPIGVLNAAQIAAHPKVQGLIAGTNDLTADLRAKPGANRAELQLALQMIILAARAEGILALDGVFNDIRDMDALALEAQQGCALGFDGKCLIHPNQIAPVAQAFMPSPAEIEDAKALIAAYEKAATGVATHNGQMIEELHVKAAKRLLQQL